MTDYKPEPSSLVTIAGKCGLTLGPDILVAWRALEIDSESVSRDSLSVNSEIRWSFWLQFFLLWKMVRLEVVTDGCCPRQSIG